MRISHEFLKNRAFFFFRCYVRVSFSSKRSTHVCTSSDSYPPLQNVFIGNSLSCLSYLRFLLYFPGKEQSFICSSTGCFPNPCLIRKNHSLCESSSCLPLRFSFKICLFTPLFPHSFFKRPSFHRSCLKLFGHFARCLTSSYSNGKSFSGPGNSEVLSVADLYPGMRKLEGRDNAERQFVLEITKIIRDNGSDFESRLSIGASRLSVHSITEIFKILSSQRISGLRFVEWIWSSNPQLQNSARICSLVINNLGRLDDYETMSEFLKMFRSKNICLTCDAFEFLLVSIAPHSIQESTNRVVDLLNRVGGSCRNSGVFALIEMFSKLDLFEMAWFVLKITEVKESYFCLLIRQKCKRGLIEDARGIIKQMRKLHLTPSTRAYNYLLGSLWKNCRIDQVFELIDEMGDIGIPPDAITFEIIILCLCWQRKMNVVHQILGQMLCRGFEPRPETHAAIIKSLFFAEKYEEAYHYVVDSSDLYKTSSNIMYCLLARLYLDKGYTMNSLRMIVTMMTFCLKPNVSIYKKTVKELERIGRSKLAKNLEAWHSKFASMSPPQHI